MEAAALTAFARDVALRYGLTFSDYEALWRWSVDDIECFWLEVWERFGVCSDTAPGRVLASREMPGATWFPGTRVNYAERLCAAHCPAAVAIRHTSELRPLGAITWAELLDRVARIAGGLRELGVREGDRVVGYLPNVPEAVAALLACASVGAIWSSCSPDFGAPSVIDRFAQIEPTVLLAVDGYRYGGRDFDRRDVLAALQTGLPTLKHTVVLGYLDPKPDLSRLRDVLSWGELERRGAGAELSFVRVPFDHPLWVLYSSGTTGLPKAIVHGHGGMLLETLKTMHLHVDAKAGDRLFWFTTTGWMMWNFLVGGLATDASIVLYDGSPALRDMCVLWDLADAAGITCFGTSAAFLGGCAKARVRPRAGRGLSALRAIGSTGSPLPPDIFDWVYQEVGPDIWLFSTSGGTDLCTAFVGGVPTLPVHRGELQARALGAKVESWDEHGRSLLNTVGELVITEPMPSMPLCLWGDTDNIRYRETYFSTYNGVWRHGDWIEITDRGTATITGRSDATINRGGVRMGTSEIYRAVLALDEIIDALVVDLPRPGTDGYMRLFVVLRPGVELDAALIDLIRARIRSDCSPRHVPDDIRVIPEVPRTLSGKALELPVKQILLGQPADAVASRDSLANPNALEVFEKLALADRMV